MIAWSSTQAPAPLSPSHLPSRPEERRSRRGSSIGPGVWCNHHLGCSGWFEAPRPRLHGASSFPIFLSPLQISPLGYTLKVSREKKQDKKPPGIFLGLSQQKKTLSPSQHPPAAPSPKLQSLCWARSRGVNLPAVTPAQVCSQRGDKICRFSFSFGWGHLLINHN